MPRRLLVALDTSRRSEVALRALPDMCGPHDEVMLLSVAGPPSRQQIGLRAPRAVTHFSDPNGTARLAPGRETPIFETQEQAHERTLAATSRYLNEKADELLDKGLRVQVQPVIARDAAEAIIDFAAQYRPDAIIMVKRRLDLRRLIFGSVTRDVQKSKVAPVVLLPSRTPGAPLW